MENILFWVFILLLVVLGIFIKSTLNYLEAEQERLKNTIHILEMVAKGKCSYGETCTMFDCVVCQAKMAIKEYQKE